jgi:hypothetical protein
MIRYRYIDPSCSRGKSRESKSILSTVTSLNDATSHNPSLSTTSSLRSLHSKSPVSLLIALSSLSPIVAFREIAGLTYLGNADPPIIPTVRSR